MEMNKKVMKAALFVVLSSMTVGCQKEDFPTNTTEITGVANPSCTLVYSINGVVFTSTYATEEECHAFMLHLMELSREGNEIVVSANDYGSNVLGTKETVTYTTPSSDDAAAWSEKMIKDGYRVYVTYDSVKKVHICVAVK